MTEGKCAIWGTPANISNEGGPPEYDSPRAGGRYRLGKKYGQDIVHRSNNFKAKLTSWLVEQRLSGVESPDFSGGGNFYSFIEERRDLSVSRKIDRLLRYCSEIRVRPGQALYTFSKAKGLGQPINGLISEEIYAWTETISFEEFLHFRCIAISLGLIEGYAKFSGDAEYDHLTALGFARLEELEKSNENSKQAFVAMWFNPSIGHIYEEAIAPAVREAGFDPIRIDRKEHNNKIDDEIIAELRRSKFVIADFTSAVLEQDGKREAISRGGVYYEAGFAHGMGIPVIWTCRADMINLVHFDTRQYNHIDWKDAADLKKRLYNRIRATIT